jgi:hypothetical protein
VGLLAAVICHSNIYDTWFWIIVLALERDAGRLGDAYQTLLQIPAEYFDDPEELEAALDFAKCSSDLNLLRRLKSRQ